MMYMRILFEENTGVTQELLNVTGAGSTAWATRDITVTAPGDYKYVFVAGTFDETFGMAAGASLILTILLLYPLHRQPL